MHILHSCCRGLVVLHSSWRQLIRCNRMLKTMWLGSHCLMAVTTWMCWAHCNEEKNKILTKRSYHFRIKSNSNSIHLLSIQCMLLQLKIISGTTKGNLLTSIWYLSSYYRQSKMESIIYFAISTLLSLNLTWTSKVLHGWHVHSYPFKT